MNLGTPQEMLYDERDYNEPLKDMKPKDRTNIMTPKEKQKFNKIIIGLLQSIFITMLVIIAYHIINWNL